MTRPLESLSRWMTIGVFFLAAAACGVEFGYEDAVADVYASFRDDTLGSWGEIREWVDDTYVAAGGVRGQSAVDLLGGENLFYWGLRAQQEWLPSWTIDSKPVGGGPSSELQDSEYMLTALSAHVDDTVRPLDGLLINAGVRAEWVPVAKGTDDVQGGDFDGHRFFLSANGVWLTAEVPAEYIGKR